jgi:hypothetical protein
VKAVVAQKCVIGILSCKNTVEVPVGELMIHSGHKGVLPVFAFPHYFSGDKSQMQEQSHHHNSGKPTSSAVSQLSTKRKITNSEFISIFTHHNRRLKLSLTMDIQDYGYDDAAPDVESRERNEFDYYYGDRENNGDDSSRRTPSRSSMKQGGAPRRSSIGYTGEITVTLPGKNRPVRRRTSISFDQKEHIKEVEPVSSLTEDPKKLWFQAEEFNMIREKARMLTYIAVNGGDGMVKAKNICTRGLESHIDSKNVQEEQSLAWKSVFLEQSHQREKGTCDDETVSEMYQLASMQSQARARIRACQDEANIVRYTRHTRRMIRRGSM